MGDLLSQLKWGRTGIVVEAMAFKQYRIKLDGSGRITLRNRRHLRKFTPFYKPTVKTPAHAINTPVVNTVPVEGPRQNQEPVDDSNETPQVEPCSGPLDGEESVPAMATSLESPPSVEPPPSPPQVPKEKPKEIKIPLALRHLFN